jgi:hypothetical protein
MRDEHAAQLLEFIRHEVIPLLLSEAVPGGLGTMIQRLKLEYPDLDLFSKAAAAASQFEGSLPEDHPELQRFRRMVLARQSHSIAAGNDADRSVIRVQPALAPRRPRRSLPAGDLCETVPRTPASCGGPTGDDAEAGVRDRAPADRTKPRRSDQRGRDLRHALK